uniref:Uncharacterized protein n=1 Tax=Glossina austeni TaxID=7395 RepID=A0A1A9UVF6_GLOAU
MIAAVAVVNELLPLKAPVNRLDELDVIIEFCCCLLLFLLSCCSMDGGDGGSVQIAMGLYESFMWSPEITIITFIFMINIWVGSVETSSAKFKELAMPAMILVLPTPCEVAALYAAAK